MACNLEIPMLWMPAMFLPACIYIHIPFCKQACHYCNFHFTTSQKRKNELVAALLKEISLSLAPVRTGTGGLSSNGVQLDKGEGKESRGLGESIETIYFGGGTPSLLDIEDCKLLIDKIRSTFKVCVDAEITIEANPDDITTEKLQGWEKTGINRLSIGIQSFFREDLLWMNRAHNEKQARQCIELSQQHGFNNISIDLIYGTPLLTNEKWEQNVRMALDYNIPHLSCYALTVEPKTVLQKLIRLHKKEDVDPDQQSEQFILLMNWLEAKGYEHYEISNFALPGFRSRHNSSYWQGKKYLGIGPSAHSFDGISRQWNVANNNIYIESLNKNIIPFEKEILTASQQLNEFIMISLRTMEGLDVDLMENKWGNKAKLQLLATSKKYISSGLLKEENNLLKLTQQGKLLADGIAADLFFE